LFDVLLDLMSH